MPPDNIIASLKQGNALELEFIKKLKEGLDVIADGMQTECYRRGDALDQLRESLGRVNLEEGHTSPSGSMAVALRSVAGSSITSTAEKKVEVVKLIKDGIRKCSEAKDAAGKINDEADNTFRRWARNEHGRTDKMYEKNATRREALMDMVAWFDGMWGDEAVEFGPGTTRYRATFFDNWDAQLSDCDEDRKALNKEHKLIESRMNNLLLKARDTRMMAVGAANQTIGLLKATAQALGVEDDIE